MYPISEKFKVNFSASSMLKELEVWFLLIIFCFYYFILYLEIGHRILIEFCYHGFVNILIFRAEIFKKDDKFSFI